MTEVIEEICRGREVVLVVQSMEEGNELAVGSGLLDELNRAREVVLDVAKRNGVVCFDTVDAGVTYMCARLGDKSKNESASAKTNASAKGAS